MTSFKKDSYKAPAVVKAFDLLKAVADSKTPLGISALAKRLDFSKSTTHGLVRALVDVGALDQETPPGKKVFLGPTTVELAFKNKNYLWISELAQPVLDRLCSRINESVFLGVIGQTGAIIMATSEPAKPLKISAPPGSVLPLMAGAIGKLYLSRQSDEQAIKVIRKRGLRKYTSNSICDETAYLAQLRSVRHQRYAVDTQEYMEGVTAVAVSLDNNRGQALAIWVVGFTNTMPESRFPEIVKHVLATREELENVLEQNR
ncbi:MAG: IclR family transcriptional regulator [Desulfobacteraceae bacterium]|nr:IclR family transcriptional regulator [Desulfobacteraceae bacterium]